MTQILDLVAAYRVLARFNIIDAYGHVSVRDPRNPSRYLMSRSVAPESVTAADILVLDLDSQIVDPEDDTLRILHLSGEKYDRIIVGGNITSPLLPGFSVTLKAIFAGPRYVF